MVFLHREVLRTPQGSYTDHVNCDKLDNQKANLRLTDYSLNNSNKYAQKNNTSGFKGVHLRKDTKRWRAYITKDRKKMHLGTFATAREAALTYNKAALKYHGAFARLNVIK